MKIGQKVIRIKDKKEGIIVDIDFDVSELNIRADFKDVDNPYWYSQEELTEGEEVLTNEEINNREHGEVGNN